MNLSHFPGGQTSKITLKILTPLVGTPSIILASPPPATLCVSSTYDSDEMLLTYDSDETEVNKVLKQIKLSRKRLFLVGLTYSSESLMSEGRESSDGLKDQVSMLCRGHI